MIKKKYINKNELKIYLKNVNNYPILNYNEELYLTKDFYYKKNIYSAKKLILSHLKFVIHVAKNYSGYGLPQSDLIQEGNIGLMKAVKKFNPEIGVKLISFAIYWIKSEIHEYVLKNWKIVKIATTKSQRKLFFNLRKTKKKIGWLNNKELNLISKKLCVKKKDIKEMELRMYNQDIALDYSTESYQYNNYQFNNSSLFYLQDKNSNFAEKIEKKIIRNIKEDKLYLAIEKLDNRSKYIIKSRWLNDNKTTLQNLANKYGVSAERVRQLEIKAMKKIKKNIDKNNIF